MAVEVMRRRFTVSEYYRMAKAGILHEDDRVELIEGEIVEMAPIGSRHAASVIRLTQLFARWPDGPVLVSVQNPLHLRDDSEPQPDVLLLAPHPDSYVNAHPGPEDVLLLVEVCDTSAAYDREVKVPLYARAGVAECWLMLLDEDCIEVYRNPQGGTYREVRRVSRGEAVTIEALAGVELSTEDLLLPE